MNTPNILQNLQQQFSNDIEKLVEKLTEEATKKFRDELRQLLTAKSALLIESMWSMERDGPDLIITIKDLPK